MVLRSQQQQSGQGPEVQFRKYCKATVDNRTPAQERYGGTCHPRDRFRFTFCLAEYGFPVSKQPLSHCSSLALGFRIQPGQLAKGFRVQPGLAEYWTPIPKQSGALRTLKWTFQSGSDVTGTSSKVLENGCHQAVVMMRRHHAVSI